MQAKGSIRGWRFVIEETKDETVPLIRRRRTDVAQPLGKTRFSVLELITTPKRGGMRVTLKGSEMTILRLLFICHRVRQGYSYAEFTDN